MPTTAHPDLWGHSITAYFFAYEGKLNIYEHLLSLPANHPLVTNIGISDIFIYPPLTYFTLGIFRVIVMPFLDANFIPVLISDPGKIFNYNGLHFQLFLFKLPYLFIDIGLGFLLANLFSSIKQKRQAFLLWMFNPLTLYATFMMGQIDILPTLFTVLALYLYKKEKLYWSVFALGIGASYKLYPIFFILPAAFIFSDKLKQRVKYIFVGLLPFVLSILPFLSSSAFRQMVLFMPKNQKMLFMNWPLSGAEVIYPFLFILALIIVYSYYTKTKVTLHVYILSILVLIFSVTHYHPQWFLWVTPLLIWQLVENKFKYFEIVCLMLITWFVIMLFFEPSLSIGLFSPINPTLNQWPGLANILSAKTDIFRLKSMLRSVFAGLSAFYIFSLFRSENNKTD